MPADLRAALKADCANCFGLCCVALPFAKTSDFAIDKAFAEPCPNLGEDFRCTIHARLRESGFRGCTVYECFGAGQRTSQDTFEGVSWREDPSTAIPMFDVFAIQRILHELLWYLAEAIEQPAAAPLATELADAVADVEALTALEPDELLTLEVEDHRGPVSDLLRRASELVRADAVRTFRPRRSPKQGRGPDFIGADLRRADLRGADLRGAYLIAADLSGADLRAADLIGADLRDTNLAGADLTGSLFLTQTQLNAAKGDASTRLPPTLEHPGHWR